MLAKTLLKGRHVSLVAVIESPDPSTVNTLKENVERAKQQRGEPYSRVEGGALRRARGIKGSVAGLDVQSMNWDPMSRSCCWVSVMLSDMCPTYRHLFFPPSNPDPLKSLQ